MEASGSTPYSPRTKAARHAQSCLADAGTHAGALIELLQKDADGNLTGEDERAGVQHAASFFGALGQAVVYAIFDVADAMREMARSNIG